MPKKETFTSRFEETRGGNPKNLKFGESLLWMVPNYNNNAQKTCPNELKNSHQELTKMF